MKKSVSQEQLKKELHEKVDSIMKNFRENPVEIAEFLRFSARFRKYSYHNTRLLYAQKPDSQFIAPASAFRAGLPDKDGEPLSDKPIWVKKGEHALRVWCPTVRTCVVDPETNEWIAVSHLSDETREKATAENWERKEIHGFTLVPVFDVGQTECPQKLYPKLLGYGTDSPDAETAFRAACTYARDVLQCEVVESADLRSSSVHGYFQPESNRIVLSDLLRGESRTSTLLHEIGHAELHRDPSALNLTTAQRELEADMYALMLEQLAGVTTTDARKRHLASHYNAYFAQVKSKLQETGEALTLGSDSEPFTHVLDRYREQSPLLERFLAEAQDIQRQLDETTEVAPPTPAPNITPAPDFGNASGLSF